MSILCQTVKLIQNCLALALAGQQNNQTFLLFACIQFVLKLVYFLLYCKLDLFLFVSFFPAARIGEGVLLDHGTGLVIGETAVVGNWVSLMQARVIFIH